MSTPTETTAPTVSSSASTPKKSTPSLGGSNSISRPTVGSPHRPSGQNKEKGVTKSGETVEKAPITNRHRKSNSKGGGGGGGSGGDGGVSGGSGASSEKKGSSDTINLKQVSSSPPGSSSSDGMSSLQNIITELKDVQPVAAAASTAASTRTSHENSSESPSRNRKAQGGSYHHRKTGSTSTTDPAGAGAATAATSATTPLLSPVVRTPSPSSIAPSILNPQAGGFQPGTLMPISDMMDEGLITPTASHFDLMTGMPRSANSTTSSGAGGVARLRQQSHDFATMSQSDLQQEQLAFASGVDRRLSFPFGGTGGLPQQQQQQQQQQPSMTPQQFMQFQQQQQQQFQMQQLASLGLLGNSPAMSPEQMIATANAANLSQANLAAAMAHGHQIPRFNPRSTDPSDLMAEQLSIQQQLEQLRIQQENLLARFGDMQQTSNILNANANLVSTAAPEVTSSTGGGPPQQGHHRRISSQQATGAMGSFSAGMGNFGQVGLGANAASALPKGHGRRQSLNVSQKGQGPSPSAIVTGGGEPARPPSSGGFASGFTFPGNGGNSGSTQQPLGESEFSASGGGGSFGHHRRTSGSMSSMGGWQSNMPTGPANLVEAQSHLQQLTAYRASAGHSRVPSFGMSTLGGGPGQLAMAGYGGGLPQQGLSASQTRKSLFAPYLPQASIPPLLAAGKLVIGVLRVNKRNRSDAYVATDSLDSDIYVCGSKDRNRALEGDIVAVELLDVDEVWGTKKEKEEKKRKKEENTSNDPRASRDIRRQDKKKDDVEVEGQGLMLFEEEEVNDEQKPQFAGHVVAVVERAPGQLFSGMLGVLRPSSAATQQKQDAERRERDGADLRGNHSLQQAPKIIWFRPTDKRVPLIAIPTEQAPNDFVDRADKYSDRLFVACIKRWPITSLHPFGTLVEELGPIGDIETETNALLKDCNFSAEDFSETVLKCLPPSPWTIPERESSAEIRRDFRKHRVFTIDPETARDLDDALHVIENEDGTFEVGVHIADVTHFVKPNTALDREARKRATTVYLTQRAVPMLPQGLSEELCSLNPGKDKLTFSVVFTLSKEGRVLSTWFGKTIINSKVKLAYSDAQEVIEGRNIPEEKVVEGAQRTEIEDDITKLAALARHLRKQRFDNGALQIDNAKVSFKLGENGMPEDCSSFERKESNELIEEFMLLANISVAGKIAAGLPEQALLRRHEGPIERRLEAYIDRMNRLGIKLDGSTAGSLMQSINKITDPAERLTLQHLSRKAMQRARYFCTGMLDIAKYHHYALSLPLYTHFTSPIRRYADIMVHRQLEAVLQGTLNGEIKFSVDPETVSKVAANCNVKKEAARFAQEQSAHLFLCVLISDLTERYGPVVRKARVIGVLDEAFDVLVPEFGIEKRVHASELPIDNLLYDEDSNSLKLFWRKGIDVLSYVAEERNDDHLIRMRNHAEHHAKSLVSSHPDGKHTPNGTSKTSKGAKKLAPSVTQSQQHKKSQDHRPLVFQELETKDGQYSQTIRELTELHVMITADMTKSPPVLKIMSMNPFM